MLKDELLQRASELGLTIGFTNKNQYEEIKPLREYLQFTKTIISVLMPISRKDGAIMASFALDKDYHLVLREKMDQLSELLVGYQTQLYVDNGPIDDRVVAYLAGLGFIGKHSLLISKKGSYHMLGEILTDAEMDIDSPIQKSCGTCTICEVACPTGCIPDAIYEKCLVGYLQRKMVLPDEIYEKFDTIYGCDICQTMCPFNRQVKSNDAYDYLDIDIRQILKANKKTFQEFKDTAFYWLGHNVMKRNVIIYAANKGINIDDLLSDVQSKQDYMLSAIDYYKRKRSE